MFNDRHQSLMLSNRQLQKNLKLYQDISIQNLQSYQLFNDSILQVKHLFIFDQCMVKSYISYFKPYLQMCDHFELKRETKYLVKKSLDLYVLKFVKLSPQEISLAAINFMLMAVKFNEDPILYQKMTIKWYLEQFQSEANPYEIEDFVQFQLQIYKQPEFSLNFTTPYDYLGLYRQAFLMSDSIVLKIRNVLDFSFTIQQLILCSAEQLFFGSMLMVYRQKIQEKKWILRQTFYPQNVIKVSQIIYAYYQMELQMAKNQMAQQ